MQKRSTTPTRDPWGRDKAFPRPGSMRALDLIEPSECVWRDCRNAQLEELPVCARHATVISWRLKEIIGQPIKNAPPPTPIPKRREYVYYLMVGPTTVKIGTTTNLAPRLSQLRTDLQYVVAIETSGRTLENQRHKEFAQERLGRREDFRLSERLKQHIEALQPVRDELVALAVDMLAPCPS